MTYGMHREGIQGSAVGMCEWISKCGIHRSQHVNFINHWGRWEYFVLQQPFRFARWTFFLEFKGQKQPWPFTISNRPDIHYSSV